MASCFDGHERAASPGFILVSSVSADGEAVGFAHIIEGEGFAHLEQLSFLPAHAHKGHGRALVEAEKLAAAARGYPGVSLRTFAEVPWNAPVYATCGFNESEPVSNFHRGIAEVENALGIGQYGRRVEMTAGL